MMCCCSLSQVIFAKEILMGYSPGLMIKKIYAFRFYGSIEFFLGG